LSPEAVVSFDVDNGSLVTILANNVSIDGFDFNGNAGSKSVQLFTAPTEQPITSAVWASVRSW